MTLIPDYRCKKGFSLLLQKCTDIDECSQNIDWCGAMKCENTIGGYSCDCPKGSEAVEVFNFEYQAIETECRDIDECQNRNTCPESSVCQNNEGSFSCLCKVGYEGEQCSDTDECTTEEANCGDKSECFNTLVKGTR